MTLQPVTIYESVQAPMAERSISDVLAGAASVVLGLSVVAVVLGFVCAGALIAIRRMGRQDDRPAGDTDATRLGLDASSPGVRPKS